MRSLKNVRYDLTAADPALGPSLEEEWKANLTSKVAEAIKGQG